MKKTSISLYVFQVFKCLIYVLLTANIFFFYQEEELEKETFFIPKSILKSKSKLDKREPTIKKDKKRTKRVFIVDPAIQKSSRKNVTRKI